MAIKVTFLDDLNKITDETIKKILFDLLNYNKVKLRTSDFGAFNDCINIINDEEEFKNTIEEYFTKYINDRSREDKDNEIEGNKAFRDIMKLENNYILWAFQISNYNYPLNFINLFMTYDLFMKICCDEEEYNQYLKDKDFNPIILYPNPIILMNQSSMSEEQKEKISNYYTTRKDELMELAMEYIDDDSNRPIYIAPQLSIYDQNDNLIEEGHGLIPYEDEDFYKLREEHLKKKQEQIQE